MTKTSQQRWNENNPEKVQESRFQYEKQYKKITIRLNKRQDEELLSWYDRLSREEKSDIKQAFKDFLYKYKENN